MEIKEIRKKSDKELTKILAEQREKLRDLRFKINSRQYKNYKEANLIKKNIARILTVINERRHYREITVSTKSDSEEFLKDDNNKKKISN